MDRANNVEQDKLRFYSERLAIAQAHAARNHAFLAGVIREIEEDGYVVELSSGILKIPTEEKSSSSEVRRSDEAFLREFHVDPGSCVS